jgi:hypothetical protein
VLDFSGCNSRQESQHGYGFETGKVPLDLKPKPVLGFTSAANPVLLPKAKPRAMREHFVVPSIRSGEVAPAEGSGVRRCEDALKALDVGNSLLGVHSVSISDMNVAIVKRSGIGMSCLAAELMTNVTCLRIAGG